MSDEHSAESGAGYSYVEYGVLVDRTAVGLGVELAETTRDFDRAERLAQRSPDAWGYPAEVRQRVVSMTDWQPMTRVTPPTQEATDADA